MNQKPRIFWLYESPKKSNFAYVRPAIGQFENEYPRPASYWMRVLPPPKLIEYTAYTQLEQQIKDMEEMHSLGLQCYQDRCEGALIEVSVAKNLRDKLAKAENKIKELELELIASKPIYSRRQLEAKLLEKEQIIEKAVVQLNSGDGYFSLHKAIFQLEGHIGHEGPVIHIGPQIEPLPNKVT